MSNQQHVEYWLAIVILLTLVCGSVLVTVLAVQKTTTPKVSCNPPILVHTPITLSNGTVITNMLIIKDGPCDLPPVIKETQ